MKNKFFKHFINVIICFFLILCMISSENAFATSNNNPTPSFTQFLSVDLSTLYKDLSSVQKYGHGSSVCAFGDMAFPVVTDGNGNTLVAAARYGKGKIVIAGNEDYIKLSCKKTDKAGFFTRNILSWLTQNAQRNSQKGITNSYSEALSGKSKMRLLTKGNITIDASLPIVKESVTKFTAQKLNPSIYPVVVISDYDIDNDEAAALKNYVDKGGSIFFAVKGWVMQCYPSNSIQKITDDKYVNLKIYPLQKFFNAAGLGMEDDFPFWDVQNE